MDKHFVLDNFSKREKHDTIAPKTEEEEEGDDEGARRENITLGNMWLGQCASREISILDGQNKLHHKSMFATLLIDVLLLIRHDSLFINHYWRIGGDFGVAEQYSTGFHCKFDKTAECKYLFVVDFISFN